MHKLEDELKDLNIQKKKLERDIKKFENTVEGLESNLDDLNEEKCILENELHQKEVELEEVSMKLITTEKEIDLINTIIKNHNKKYLEKMKEHANAYLTVRFFNRVLASGF